ncbi:MAG: hypothetical protein IJW24_00970, partial [Clostridia bacterium]|nr:hypothetical protein [Clostridia bacterium]
VSNFSYIDPYGPADTDYYYYKKIDGTSTYGLTQFLDVTIGYYDENENFQTDVYNDVYYLSSSVSGYELNISFLQKDNDAFTTVLYDGQGMCPEWNFKYHENTLRIYASVHFATVTIENGDGLIDFSERFYAENNAEAVRVYVDDNAGTVSVDGKVYMASEVDGASFLGWSVSGSVSNYDQSNLCYVLYTEDAITITPLYEDVAMITVLDYQGNEAVQICDMRTIGVTMSNASMSVAFDELTGVDDYYVNRKIDVDDTPYYFVYWAYKLDSEEWVECVEFTDLEISIESKIVIKPVYEIGKISLTIADLLDKTIYDEDQIVLEFNSNQITIVNGSETTSIIDPVANFTYWEISYNYGVSYESVESGTQITIKRGDVIILRAVYMTNW